MSELEQAIKDNAAGPKSATNDTGSVSQHSLKDQIEADRYVASKNATKRKGLPIKRTRTVSPGAV